MNVLVIKIINNSDEIQKDYQCLKLYEWNIILMFPSVKWEL